MKIVNKKEEERKATGIPGFDKLCSGGFIRDSINLIVGNAGAGKTTFLLQFLYNGATIYDEKGLYVSFEPEVSDLYRTGKLLGMDFESLEKQGKCLFLKLGAGLTVKDMEEKLTKIIMKEDIERVCFDPINVFSVDLPREISLRKQIYNFLSLLKKLDVCILIAGEADEDLSKGYSLPEEIQFSKYAADGVVELFSSGISGEGDRAIRISKMRMTNHFRGPIGMQLTDKGIKILK
jgi:circadian clock protein KaiC